MEQQDNDDIQLPLTLQKQVCLICTILFSLAPHTFPRPWPTLSPFARSSASLMAITDLAPPPPGLRRASASFTIAASSLYWAGKAEARCAWRLVEQRASRAPRPSCAGLRGVAEDSGGQAGTTKHHAQLQQVQGTDLNQP